MKLDFEATLAACAANNSEHNFQVFQDKLTPYLRMELTTVSGAVKHYDDAIKKGFKEFRRMLSLPVDTSKSAQYATWLIAVTIGHLLESIGAPMWFSEIVAQAEAL